MKNVLIDTNYLLRFLIGDLPQQQKFTKEFFRKIEQNKIKGFLSILVINELIWILENFYEKKRREYLPPISQLISLKNIKIKEIKKEDLIEVLKAMEKNNLDFTDLYLNHLSKKANYKIATFDKKLKQHFSA